jgi:hypothetical protein
MGVQKAQTVFAAAYPDPFALAAIQTAIADQWIKTTSPQSSVLLRILLSSLHKGEAEAIALAGDLKADIVIIDEQDGREMAIQAGLSVTGILKIDGQLPLSRLCYFCACCAYVSPGFMLFLLFQRHNPS